MAQVKELLAGSQAHAWRSQIKFSIYWWFFNIKLRSIFTIYGA